MLCGNWREPTVNSDTLCVELANCEGIACKDSALESLERKGKRGHQFSMANPSGNNEEDQTTHVASSFNGNLAADTSPTALAMKHNSGIALDWTPQEQTILEEGLSLYDTNSSFLFFFVN